MIGRWQAGVIAFVCCFALLETRAMGGENFLLFHRVASLTTSGELASVTMEFQLINNTQEQWGSVTLLLLLPPPATNAPRPSLNVGNMQAGEQKQVMGTFTIPVADLQLVQGGRFVLCEVRYLDPLGMARAERVRGLSTLLPR